MQILELQAIPGSTSLVGLTPGFARDHHTQGDTVTPGYEREPLEELAPETSILSIMGNIGSCASSRKSERQYAGHGPQVVCLGPADIKDTTAHFWSDREHGKVSWKTLISSDLTPSNSITTGIASCPPRRENQPYSAGGNLGLHRHRQAEVYIILSGEGIVNVDMIEYPVEAGSVLFIPGSSEHSVRNMSLTEDLVWYYCLATDSFKDVRSIFRDVPLRIGPY